MDLIKDASLPSEQTFAIGELSEELGITTRTIRFYEERGLISPTRSEGNQRIYSRKDRGRLKLILRHRDGGFTLDELRELLDIYEVSPNADGQRKQFQRIQEILRKRMTEVEERIHTLSDLKNRMQERMTWAEREILKID
ncbi:MAG: MerR family transcriptional regulator [Anaerolineae bacterium]|nr:MerR family transcriptional regulator [Anaerolineae bacterium]